MKQEAIGTTRSTEWATPQDLFDELDAEFNFDLDPCATAENAKCSKYFTIKENGLWQEWTGTVFMNPPYGRGIEAWIQKAHESSMNGATVVCLLFSRTDTKWFHNYVYKKTEIRFIKGRLKFGNSKNSAPFPSMIVIFRGEK